LPPRKIFKDKDQGDKIKENVVDVGTDINGNLAMTTAVNERKNNSKNNRTFKPCSTPNKPNLLAI
jgi:hypothetical protein